VDHSCPGQLSNLGVALWSRFERTGQQGDLDEAVVVGRQAVQATPDDHPDRAAMLSNLGLALQTRFGRTGQQGDLDEAVAVGRQAVQATPVDHPDRAGRLSNLGLALQTRFERTGQQGDLDEAVAVGRRPCRPPLTTTRPGHVPVQPRGRAAHPVRTDRAAAGLGRRGRCVS
jgi:hypothetical protein